jgi:hypothetical protein
MARCGVPARRGAADGMMGRTEVDSILSPGGLLGKGTSQRAVSAGKLDMTPFTINAQ